ncbi:MAG: hypothetical protein FWH06_06915, partial [Oscillospiraceae bacterium]|nr:hypothetical protein [Oscillospiraceae bacterium]
MEAKIAFFLLSIALFYMDGYLVFGIWFHGKRSAYLKIFFGLGLMISAWALFNGISVLLSEELYRLIYPLYFSLACFIPPLWLLYVLHFTGSRFARSRALAAVLIALATLDLLALATNPWHGEFIAGYNGLLPVGGKWFPVHAIIGYAALVVMYIIFFRYIFKNIRKNPSLILVGFAVVLPIVFNVLYTFDILNYGFDVTPFAFLVMFIIFTLYSARLRLFDNRSAALMNLFRTLPESLLVVDKTGYVADANPSFKNAFPGLPLEHDKTTIADVVSYFESAAAEQGSADIIKRISASDDDIYGAEITLLWDGTPSYYIFSKNNIYQRAQHVGFIVTLTDVSNNQRTKQMIDEINQQNERLREMKDIAESASKAKSEFLSAMSHEMRTPMNAIIGMTAIGNKTNDMGEKNRALSTIGDASSHLLGVINDILDMAKIEANKLELVTVEFNFNEVVQKVLRVANFRVDEKHQRLSTKIDG